MHKRLPSGCCTTRPKGPKTAQISPLTEKAIFRLDERSDFWEPRTCYSIEIPATPAPKAGFAFLGCGFPSRTVETTRTRITRALRESPSKLCSVQVSSRYRWGSRARVPVVTLPEIRYLGISDSAAARFFIMRASYL